jgi:plasmid rolling circle replication initiator protein Rep
MALGGPEGEILLIYEMYMQETNLNEFKTVLLNFLNISKVWEVFIQSEDSSMNETAHDSLDILNFSA